VYFSDRARLNTCRGEALARKIGFVKSKSQRECFAPTKTAATAVLYIADSLHAGRGCPILARMTYCLSLLSQDGLVFLSDSRSNAGMDSIATHRKMHVYEKPGDRVIVLQSSGNLSLTHSALALIAEDLLIGETKTEHPHLLNQKTLFETARYIGQKVREVEKLDRANLEKDDYKFNIHFLVGGQIGEFPHGLWYVYPQGNVMHASIETPFLQVGESKYGKPILDRGFRFTSSLDEATKFGVLSMDSTMKSNLSVGPPVDIVVYEKDALRINRRAHLTEKDPYLQSIRQQWGEGLARLAKEMPDLQFEESTEGSVCA